MSAEPPGRVPSQRGQRDGALSGGGDSSRWQCSAAQTACRGRPCRDARFGIGCELALVQRNSGHPAHRDKGKKKKAGTRQGWRRVEARCVKYQPPKKGTGSSKRCFWEEEVVTRSEGECAGKGRAPETAERIPGHRTRTVVKVLYSRDCTRPQDKNKRRRPLGGCWCWSPGHWETGTRVGAGDRCQGKSPVRRPAAILHQSDSGSGRAQRNRFGVGPAIQSFPDAL